MQTERLTVTLEYASADEFIRERQATAANTPCHARRTFLPQSRRPSGVQWQTPYVSVCRRGGGHTDVQRSPVCGRPEREWMKRCGPQSG